MNIYKTSYNYHKVPVDCKTSPMSLSSSVCTDLFINSSYVTFVEPLYLEVGEYRSVGDDDDDGINTVHICQGIFIDYKNYASGS
jgi:hypothetical protein